MPVRIAALTLLVSSAVMASVSLGFRKTAVPVLVLPGDQLEENVYMLCLGYSAAGGFDLEVSAGMDRSESEISEAVTEDETFCVGAGAFRRVASASHTSLSAGARFDYSRATSGMQGVAGESETRSTAFCPLLRADLSLPGVERLGLFLEWGGRWISASTTSEDPEAPNLEFEYSRSEWSTVASEDILAGMAWTF
ncbi:MAG: hypothetical protein R6U36_01115 [Candidatus Fermentibacteraceae bacterium]